MIAPTFEIKIALLGNVSAGKTTVLNALFCDKFGEVSMTRTTAGINFFRVHTTEASGEPTTVTNSSDSASMSSDSVASLSTATTTTTRTAQSILKEISQDNVKLRMADEIQEKIFDIAIKQELVTMRKDTKLVFVDIPGINEANVVNKYKDYVSENWESFDCVMVVMDARLGVNTEDQVFLLSFVKEQLKKKDIPIIILCNKVDDPEDEEQAALVHESRKEVEKIFEATCREKALTKVLNKSKADDRSLSPAFIPVSAIHAFIYQSASLMSRETFTRFDMDLLEKLGREQIGRRRWNQLTKEQKYDEAYKVIKEGHQDGMKDCNFDKLLAVLQYFLGGDEAQLKVIELQCLTAVRSLSERPFPPGGLTALVKAIYEKRKALHASDNDTLQVIASMDLVESFWKTYESFEDETFQNFVSDFPNRVNLLSDLMSNLVSYHKLARMPDWKDTSAHVVEKMEKLIQRYFKTLIDLEHKDQDACKWGLHGKTLWISEITKMTPHSWSGVWGSLLLLSFSKTFNEFFGQEKIIFERLSFDANSWCQSYFDGKKCPNCQSTLHDARGTQNKYCSSCSIVYAAAPPTGSNTYCPGGCNYYLPSNHYCPGCQRTYRYEISLRPKPWYNAQGQLLPCEQPVPHIVAPKRFSDPSHIAHIVWMFCNFIKSRETDIPLLSQEKATAHTVDAVKGPDRADSTLYTGENEKEETAKHELVGHKVDTFMDDSSDGDY